MSSSINLLNVLTVILKHRKSLLLNFAAITVIAFVVAFALPKYYKSELVFMPKSTKGSGLFSLIGNNFAADMFGESPFSKRQFIALLYSREIREDLIKKFNLIEVYKLQKRPNALDLALKNLEHIIKIQEDEEGGLGITDVITVRVAITDRSPQRASDMTNYLYTAMIEKVKKLTNTEYDLLYIFLSKQTVECDSILNINRNALKEFQIKNHVYNIPQQISLVLQNLSATKAQLLAVENEMNYLRKLSSSDYSGILTLQMKRKSLLEKISEIENSQNDDVFLGLKKSVNISNEYFDLYTNVEIYTQLQTMLRQQLEQARIKSQKQSTDVYLIDQARPAQWKDKPKRSIVILAVVFPYMLLVLGMLLIKQHYSMHGMPEELRTIMKFNKLSLRK